MLVYYAESSHIGLRLIVAHVCETASNDSSEPASLPNVKADNCYVLVKVRRGELLLLYITEA